MWLAGTLACFHSSYNSSLYGQDPGKNLLTFFPALHHLPVTCFLSHFYFYTYFTFKISSLQRGQKKVQ